MTEKCTYKIEHGIPIPKQKCWLHSRWKNLAESMNEGDSVVLQNHAERSALNTQVKRSGRDIRLISRKMECGTIRVWIAKKPPARNEYYHDGTPIGSKPTVKDTK